MPADLCKKFWLRESTDRSRWTTRIDDCRDGILLFGAILRSRHNVHKSLYVAACDIVKVSDSVQYSALTVALLGDGWKTALLRIRRAVKLEDSLRVTRSQTERFAYPGRLQHSDGPTSPDSTSRMWRRFQQPIHP